MRHILDQHRAIAWDMDETLVNGPHSEMLRAFLVSTSTTHTHHIVTFRDPDWADEIPDELAALGVARDCYRDIHSCPQELLRANYLLEQARRHVCKLTRARLLREHDQANLEADSLLYVEWKGLKAKELGCTLLVDDNHGHVVPGCIKHGITFLHSFGADYVYEVA